MFEVVQTLIGLGDGNNSTYHDQPCPFCGGKDRYYFYREKGTFHCRKCGFSWDIIDLVEEIKGVTKTEAFDIIAKHVGYVDGAVSTKGDSPKSETKEDPEFQTSKLIEDSTFKQVQRHRPEISFDDYKRVGAKLFLLRQAKWYRNTHA